jgi:toxin HigB-1
LQPRPGDDHGYCAGNNVGAAAFVTGGGFHRSVPHRGLLRLIEDDDSRELRNDLVRRLRNILAVLIAAADMSGVTGPPSWRIHQPQGRPCRNVEHFGQWQLAADV